VSLYYIFQVGEAKLEKVNTRFQSSGEVKLWEQFGEEHRAVKTWMRDRPVGTKQRYVAILARFCGKMSMTPTQFQALPQKKARDLVWNYVSEFKGSSPSTALTSMSALKSFYRNKDGEKLTFDSARGGKHYIPNRRIRTRYESVPNKEDMYRMIDVAGSLRNRAMLLILFQSGIRVNALLNLQVGHIRSQLYPEPHVPLKLKITDEIDTKLRGYQLDYYYTFLQAEAAQALREYLDFFHKDSPDGTLLFQYYKYGSNQFSRQPGIGRLHEKDVWDLVKRCARKTGRDPKTIWTHTIRRSFRKVVRAADIDEDFKEALMGHLLRGSRENYFDRHDIEKLEQEYMKIDFSREMAGTEKQALKAKIESLSTERLGLEVRVEKLESMLKELKNLLQTPQPKES